MKESHTDKTVKFQQGNKKVNSEKQMTGEGKPAASLKENERNVLAWNKGHRRRKNQMHSEKWRTFIIHLVHKNRHLI